MGAILNSLARHDHVEKKIGWEAGRPTPEMALAFTSQINYPHFYYGTDSAMLIKSLRILLASPLIGSISH